MFYALEHTRYGIYKNGMPIVYYLCVGMESLNKSFERTKSNIIVYVEKFNKTTVTVLLNANNKSPF